MHISTIDHDADDTSTYSLVSGPGQGDNDILKFWKRNSPKGNIQPGNKRTTQFVFKPLTWRPCIPKELFLRTNEAPSNITLSAELIENNLKPGTTVGRINTTDKDVNESFTYSLASGFGDTDNPAFKITGSKLKIRENRLRHKKLLFNSNSNH